MVQYRKTQNSVQSSISDIMKPFSKNINFDLFKWNVRTIVLKRFYSFKITLHKVIHDQHGFVTLFHLHFLLLAPVFWV